jgi:hypothetical protein
MPLIRQETPIDLSRETLERMHNYAIKNYNEALRHSTSTPTTSNVYTTAFWDGYLVCIRQLREMDGE